MKPLVKDVWQLVELAKLPLCERGIPTRRRRLGVSLEFLSYRSVIVPTRVLELPYVEIRKEIHNDNVNQHDGCKHEVQNSCKIKPLLQLLAENTPFPRA